MWITATIAFCLLGAVTCMPKSPIVTPRGNFSTEPIRDGEGKASEGEEMGTALTMLAQENAEDREWLHHHLPEHRGTYPTGFNLMYVSQDGQISPDHRPAGHWIKMVGSPGVRRENLYVACLEIVKMMKHTQPAVFNRLANSVTGVGLFTASETLTIFPEFYSLADTPQCRNRCDGSCSHTCTFDGRKYSEIAGVSNTLSVVLVDNVLCTPHEPYHHRDNIMVHEFAHSVDRYGLSATQQQAKHTAYNTAKARSTWRLDTYAMANSAEYFAEGTGAYFLVNLQTGGMTDCHGGQCRTEQDARNYIHSRDSQLYNLLTEVYTNNHPHTASGLTICYH